MSSTEYPAPCCIISDMLVGWTQALAANFGIPRFVLHTQSAANLSLMLQVPTLLAEGRLPLTANNQDEPIEIPGLKVPLPTSELPSDLHPDAIAFNGYGLFLRISRRAAEAPMVLVNTFRELKDDVFAALDELHGNAAGQIPGAIAELDETIMRFLNKQPRRSVLYMAFGTIGIMVSDGQIEEMALGLEASGQPFLWIAEAGSSLLRPNAPTLVQLLPPGFLERTKERGMVVSAWVPQLRILQHPATGAFLSHCGWNSIHESIAAGLPILAWPQRAEQKMNCRFLVDIAKVAAEFKRGEDGIATRTEIERVARLVMQQEEGRALQSNMASLKKVAAKNASSVDGVKTFIALCEDHQCLHKPSPISIVNGI